MGDGTPTADDRYPVFNFEALRLMMGIIAISMPWVVYWIAGDPDLESISASYHTKAQDALVGMLFVVGAFLLAYRGRSRPQGFARAPVSQTHDQLLQVGAIAAIVVATFPTSTSAIRVGTSYIHYAAAIVLFSVFVFFCYEFRKATKDGTDIEKKRSPYYVVCGIAMAAAMLFIVIVRLAEVPADLGLVFWGEAAALTFFGVAWIISGKAVPYLSIAPPVFLDTD